MGAVQGRNRRLNSPARLLPDSHDCIKAQTLIRSSIASFSTIAKHPQRTSGLPPKKFNAPAAAEATDSKKWRALLPGLPLASFSPWVLALQSGKLRGQESKTAAKGSGEEGRRSIPPRRVGRKKTKMSGGFKCFSRPSQLGKASRQAWRGGKGPGKQRRLERRWRAAASPLPSQRRALCWQGAFSAERRRLVPAPQSLGGAIAPPLPPASLARSARLGSLADRQNSLL